MTVLNAIQKLLSQCSGPEPKFPPTDLFNEGWMLRIVLDCFANHPDIPHQIAIPSDSNWFSEAELPSTFLARYRGDKYAEGYTHADGVVGQFKIGTMADADFVLKPDANRFVVTEAKMFSKLSAGTTRARYYNQAARNVACMAEIIRRANTELSDLAVLGFYVLAPESRIDAGTFKQYMNKEHIAQIVKRRVDEYDEDKGGWFSDAFLPVLEKMTVACISWEALVKLIIAEEPAIAKSLAEFYSHCLKYNSRA